MEVVPWSPQGLSRPQAVRELRAVGSRIQATRPRQHAHCGAAPALCAALALQIGGKQQRPSRACIARSSMQGPLERHLWEAGNSYDLLEVTVRQGEHTIKLKRYAEQGRSGKAAVLILHDGPGLPSRYLEPLAARLCAGRICFMYDQLGCGISAANGSLSEEGEIQPAVADLRDVLMFLRELGQAEVHVVAHGFGGALIMQAMVRDRLWSDPAESLIPQLKSVCLIGVPCNVAQADAEAHSLMEACVTEVGDSDAAKSFWYRHVCALKPQPECLGEAYKSSFGQRWGPLRGWDWKLESPDGTLVGRWMLRGKGALPDWDLKRTEVEHLYAREASLPPILCLRGQHDFVTKDCLDAWRGVADARGRASGYFTESELGGCGHHAHLEAPDPVAATLRLWLLDVEDGGLFRCDEPEPPPEHSAAAKHCRPLWREEARQALADWASQMCWESARRAPERPGAWRSVGQGLPHRDAFAPSRTARRLAEWAWELPTQECGSAAQTNTPEVCTIGTLLE
ncbi:pip, partial [Symbiodinium natans]